MNKTLNLYSIFYYNMSNIRVLIILKYFGDLDFECCVCREREAFFNKKEMET